MVNVSLLFHANLLYAEYPFLRIPEIVEQSYIPMLKAVLARKSIKAVFNFSGFTLELLAGEHPDLYPGKPQVIALVKEGVARGQIEITGTSWAHAVLPALPLALQVYDIRLYQATAERVFGFQPAGFFPPELGISPLIPEILLKAGYRWCVVDREMMAFSQQGYLNDCNDFNRRPPSFTKLTALAQQGGAFAKLKTLRAMSKIVKSVHEYFPIEWLGAGEAKITAFPLESAWIALSLLCLSRTFLFNEGRLARKIKGMARRGRGFFFPYSSDIEFFGVGGNTLATPIPVSRIEKLFMLLEQEGVTFLLPSEYLKDHSSFSHTWYCKAGSWSTDKNFALWSNDPDNQILDGLCRQAWETFREKQAGLSETERNDLLKDLLLSYNSDGRGWTPLPEHRLFCYNKAKKVLGSQSNW